MTFEDLPENIACFHAGTKMDDGKVLTSGGRVFGVTAWTDSIADSVRQVYDNIYRVSFDGVQYRRDIARLAL